MAGGFYAIHHRHADIQQGDIDPILIDDVDGFTPVGRFAGQFERKGGTAVVKQIFQPVTGRGFVIDDQDTGNRLAHAAASGT